MTTNTVGTGKTYTTLQAWEDASPANLVTDGNIWRGEASGTFTAGIIISGVTTDSTHYLELTTEAGASFRDNASVQTNALRYNASNGCAINFSTNWTSAIDIRVEYTRVSNLQVQHTGNNYALTTSAGANNINVLIDSCILESVNTSIGVINLYGTNQVIRKSSITHRGSGASYLTEMSNGAKAYGCTFAVPNDKTKATSAFRGQYAALTLSNCAFFGATNASSVTAPTCTTCYTDIASPPAGCTTATYNTTQFQNITDATRDYRIPTGSAMKDTGTTDSTNDGTDIVGTTRPQGSAYDVGCWEFVVAADNLWAQACL